MKRKILVAIICLLTTILSQASEFRPLMGLNLGYGYLSAEEGQLDKKGINFGAKFVGSFEFKEYFLDTALGYQVEYLKADYISIQNNTPIGELSVRKKLNQLSFGPMLQAQSGVYSSKPTTDEDNEIITNVGFQAVYKVDDYKPRYEVSVLNSIGSDNMSDRNLTAVRFGIQIPLSSKSKTENSQVKKEKNNKHKSLPVIIIPGFVSEETYVSQTTNLGFKKNSYQLDNHSYTKINKLASFLSLNKIKIQKIEIYGHTDKLGTEDYNLNLSTKRANVVKEIFVKHNLDANIVLISSGKGFEEPIEALEKKQSVKNRRTEIKFIGLETSNEYYQKLNNMINKE